MSEDSGMTINGLDILMLFRGISKLGKKYQAITLNDVEQVLGQNSPEYQQIRKIILDNYNDFSRSVLGIIFGDIDYRWR